MTHCLRCGRTLKAPTPTGLGPVCARAMYGIKPRRVKRERKPDERQAQLFEGRAAA